MVDLCKEKLQGVIAHFHAPGFVLTIGEHALKIAAKLFNGRMLGIFIKECLKIIDVPPVTLTCADT
jgi:hypothetical protein